MGSIKYKTGCVCQCILKIKISICGTHQETLCHPFKVLRNNYKTWLSSETGYSNLHTRNLQIKSLKPWKFWECTRNVYLAWCSQLFALHGSNLYEGNWWGCFHQNKPGRPSKTHSNASEAKSHIYREKHSMSDPLLSPRPHTQGQPTEILSVWQWELPWRHTTWLGSERTWDAAGTELHRARTHRHPQATLSHQRHGRDHFWGQRTLSKHE